MRTLLLTFALLVPSVLIGGEVLLSGTYRGKDVYIRNPFDRSTGTFCTTEVYVNNQLKISQPRASAFKLDLSYLSIGSTITIRIQHREGCTPVIINPEVLQDEEGFRFIAARASNNAIDWRTEGEMPNGKFVLEQELFDLDSSRVWKDVSEIDAKGGIGQNSYSIASRNYPGENRYRIRYEAENMESVYSVDILYTSTKNPITFYPVSVTTRITLSEPTDYEITDRYGRSVKSGFGSVIQCQELKPGEYYLHIQNRLEKFVKK